MNEVLGWLCVALVLVLIPAAGLGTVLWFASPRRSVEEKYPTAGGGLAGGFDAIWSPSAHEAGMERDRQTQRTAPAPAPGDPPWAIEKGRIRIDV